MKFSPSFRGDATMTNDSMNSKMLNEQSDFHAHNSLVATLTAIVLMLLAGTVWGQSSAVSQPPSSTAGQAPSATPAAISIPAGTRIELVLTKDVDSREVHHGDQIHAQITDPVVASGRGVIPPGAFLQAEVKKLAASHSRAEILLDSASIIFPDGGVLAIPGPLTIETGEYTAWRNPSDAKRTAAFVMPLVGAGLGTLIGSRFHTTKTVGSGPTALTATSTSMKALTIGSTVGIGAGLTTMALLLRTHHFFLAQGSPMELRLSAPVAVPSAEVSAAGASAPGSAPQNR